MRIGPLTIERRRERPATPREEEYAQRMPVKHTTLPDGTPLPAGVFRYGPTDDDRLDFGFTPWTPEEIERNTTVIPARITDPDEAIRNMHEVSGSISIGRPPRKSDYRARWRYNSEIFDDED